MRQSVNTVMEVAGKLSHFRDQAALSPRSGGSLSLNKRVRSSLEVFLTKRFEVYL